MENFWQQFCNKNIVHQASSVDLGQKTTKPEMDFSKMELFTLPESEVDIGDAFVPAKKTKTSLIPEPHTTSKPQKTQITFNDQLLDIETYSVKNKDGTTTVTGEKNFADGRLTYNATLDKDGNIIEYHTVLTSRNGNKNSEFFKQYKDENGSTKQMDGICESTVDENGNEKLKDKYIEITDKETGEVESIVDNNQLTMQKKTENGLQTTKTILGDDGKPKAYRIETQYTDGRGEATFYEERDKTRPDDKSTKFVKGTETWKLDENGEMQKVSYRSECRDKQTGALEIVNDGVGDMNGVREQKRDYYEWANEIYQGSAIERGEEQGISRSCAIEFDKDGQVIFQPDSDTITIDADKKGEEDFKFSTNDFEKATSVKIAAYDDNEMTEFTDIPQIKEPTGKTVSEDIIKNGGEIQHILSDGTTKTEFYKVVDGEIVTGYTTINTESGLVIDDYRAVYDATDTDLNNPKSKQQIVYDETTGKHTGEKKVYDITSGTSEYSHSYYLQGVLGDTMRYTTGTFDEEHRFTADGSEDTVKFEQAGKEYSVSQLQELLIFQKDYSQTTESKAS